MRVENSQLGFHDPVWDDSPSNPQGGESVAIPVVTTSTIPAQSANGISPAVWAAIAIGALLFVGGCAALPGDPSKMTPEQLKANAKDRNSAVACSNGKTAAGNVTLIYVNADQGARLSGTVNVKADCETTISTSYEAPASAAK